MSVLIKGMKMPTTCEKCDFCHWSNLHQTGICDRCGDEPVCPDYGTDYKRTRARFCPLIELPEKHGGLIDGDVLWDAMSKYSDNEGAKWPFGYDDTLIHRDSACFVIENAPIVIEAEGE